jgi:hypothetical protein
MFWNISVLGSRLGFHTFLHADQLHCLVCIYATDEDWAAPRMYLVCTPYDSDLSREWGVDPGCHEILLRLSKGSGEVWV